MQRPVPRQDDSSEKGPTQKEQNQLRVETLEICPRCGEPVLGPHKCGELSELVASLGPESAAAKTLTHILEEAKKLWGKGEAETNVVEFSVYGRRKDSEARGLDEDDIPGFHRKGVENLDLPLTE